ADASETSACAPGKRSGPGWRNNSDSARCPYYHCDECQSRKSDYEQNLSGRFILSIKSFADLYSVFKRENERFAEFDQPYDYKSKPVIWKECKINQRFRA